MVSTRGMLRIVAFAAAAVAMTQADNQCSAIPDVDFPGNDIKTTDRANPGDCCADCLATPQCTAYNWDSGVCYLKSSQGTMSPLPGGVSGVVVKTTPAPTTVAPTTMAPTSAPTKAPTSAPTKAPTSAPTMAPTAAPTPAPTVAPSCKRIRKSWEALTAAEKDTYISAIELAMDKGMYQKFVQIHKETMSTAEGHGTCVFLFWHRKLLLAYENMLRSLGDRFKCLTLPYWDYVQNYATMQNTPVATRCKSLESCSAVLREMGGTAQYKMSSKPLFGYTFSDQRCVTARPANHMCTAAGAGNSQCDHCIPRGMWSSTPMTADMSIDSVRGQVLYSGTSIASVSRAMESSPHASIHIRLSGPQNVVAVSPMDPIFFIHHNTLDLLHTIFYHCNVEPLGLTDEQKKTDARSFQGCRTKNGDPIGPTSPVMMRVESNAGAIDIQNDPLVGEFFRSLPNKYYQFTDARTLGYSYEVKGLLGDLYTKCDGAGPMVMPRTESASNATALAIDHVVQPVTLQENLNVLSFEDAVLAQAAKQGLTRDQGFKELRKMTIMLQQNCLTGDVTDFTDEQKKMFHVEVSPSFAILSKIQSGEDPIRIDGWPELLFKYYGCHGNVKEQ
ncbi:hypothetical protein DYB32_009299 [Aphanomyces invadans]|uniref:Apple domain-containing protein n=1 Tax=Aphanomyces invadans TaxID=157072 RepID=A0A3R6VQU0_9STRA|nr:hypothetical protein DYB32_009299 [Aphanomyces invadans]